MKYLIQFMIILIFVFLGEICEHFIPLPIAGSIYGLLLLFIGVITSVVSICILVILLGLSDIIAKSLVSISVITALAIVLSGLMTAVIATIAIWFYFG